jgi:hypothetical protein
LAHGLHAVFGFLVFEYLVREWPVESVTAKGHGFATNGKTTIDTAQGDLIRNILNSLET